MSSHQSAGYAGDVTALEAFAELGKRDGAVLVDVRTRAEWAFVGLPDLSQLKNEPILLEWQEYPDMASKPDFVDRLRDSLRACGAGPESTIYFLCRSGARSRAAAITMTKAGYSSCFNISDGFEGPLDAHRRRGGVAGWKASNLPWAQT